ncbi:hypothetical protein OS493_018057, partial [Desmophyllum pertusum]
DKTQRRNRLLTMWQSTDVIVFKAGLADSIRLLFCRTSGSAVKTWLQYCPVPLLQDEDTFTNIKDHLQGHSTYYVQNEKESAIV